MTLRRKASFKRKIFWTGCLVSGFILGGLFLNQFNALIYANYEIGDYDRRIVQLAQENESLETNFLKANHLKNVETVAQSLSFEKTEKVYYIKATPSAVVSK